MPRFYLLCIILFCFSLSVFAQAPANDNCIGATVLTIQNGNCTTTATGNTNNATKSLQTAFIPFATDDDIWFKFNTPASPEPGNLFFRFNVLVQLSNVVFTGDKKDIYLERRENPANICDNFFEDNQTLSVGNGNTASIFLNGLLPGTQYSLRLYTDGDVSKVAFNICLSFPSPPANDNCDQAALLNPALNECIATGPFSTVSATKSPQVSGDGSGRDDDVWFSFTTDNVPGKYSVELSNLVYNTGFGNSVIELWGACGTVENPAEYLLFSPFSTKADFGLLAASTTYRVRVYTYSTSSRLTSFNICIRKVLPPVNDSCANAIPVPVGTGGAWGTPVPATTLNAVSGPPAPTSCSGTEDDDIWFTFTAPASGLVGMEINGVTNAMHPGNPAPALSSFLYSGACNALTQIRCLATNTGLLSGLIPGTVYRLRVMTTEFMQGAAFELRLREELPPANDNCSSPVLIPVNSDGTYNLFVTGTTLGAGPSGLPVTPCSPLGLNDVWFNLRAPASGTVQLKWFNVTNPAGGSTAMYAIIYGGACEAPVEIKCISANNDIITGLTPFGPYLIRIMSNTPDQVVNFSVALRELPAPMTNTTCPSARLITTEYQAGTTLGLPNANETVACYGGKAPNKVAYYYFTATATWHYLDFSNLLSLSENQPGLGFRVFSGDCTGDLIANTVYCNGGVRFSNPPLTGLVIGNTYIVQLMENTYNGGPVAFRVRVAPPEAFVWTGGTSTAWDNQLNWANKAVPGENAEVILPPGMPRYPQITINTTIRKLTASPGTSVQVAPGVHLVVTE